MIRKMHFYALFIFVSGSRCTSLLKSGLLKMKLSICIFLICMLSNVRGSRILGIFLHTGRSHFDVFQPLLVELANRGHEVTVISHFPLERPVKNYKDISLKGTLPIWKAAFHLQDFDIKPFREFIFQYNLIKMVLEFGNEACRVFLEKKEIHEFIEGQFDIGLIEMFNTDCGFPLLHKLKLPYVGISSHLPISWTSRQIGWSYNPAFAPSFHLGYPLHPTLIQRLYTFFIDEMMILLFRYVSQPQTTKLWANYMEDVPDVESLARNASLILVGIHHSFHRNRLNPPNVVEIGGLHMFKDNTTLDPNMKEFLDNAHEGVVVFSMGSLLRGVSWPEDKLEAFKSAFKGIPHTVLWKWENDTMTNTPKNVKLSKWIQQFEVLKHKNVIGMISHGGNAGMIEAMHAGKPVIAIPKYGDQFYNGASAQEKGVGILIDYNNVTHESMSWALQEILSPKMQNNAKRASEIWKDRPLDPTETAIFWIEHVIKFGGDHLRSPILNIPIYEYFSLDLLAIFAGIILIIAFILMKCISNFTKIQSERNQNIKKTQ